MENKEDIKYGIQWYKGDDISEYTFVDEVRLHKICKHIVIRFENGYGLSFIQKAGGAIYEGGFMDIYGDEESDTWEGGLVKFREDGNYEIVYDLVPLEEGGVFPFLSKEKIRGLINYVKGM